ncbi:MAG: hypothetical protein ABSH34_32555 [Verrucomicrobiota bacterium]|jgi:hypothetical protein
MGLTIHYKLRALGGEARALRLVQALRQAALDLPFKWVGPIENVRGQQCRFEDRPRDDRSRWLLIGATKWIEVREKAPDGAGNILTSHQITPLHVIGFEADPGDGCETARIGLCRYPATVSTPKGPLKTKLPGWRWSSFCKTQYASNPDCGGVENFLRCHLLVIAMLDKAKAAGCLGEVDDEGGFWENRDLRALVREVGEWNEQIAAGVGRLKDLLGPGVLSEITRFPNFEQLEADGQ